jgi:hypothetical protein
MPTFTNSANGTAGAAASYTSTIRWAYIYVENTGTAGVLWVRTDGTAAAAADGSYSVPPGGSLVVANALAWWSQAASVIPASASGAGAYTNASGNGPLGVTPMGTSPYGQLASPGTNVSVFSAGTPTFTISGTG